ncbi:hypothetical protein LCL89_11350 [Halobacillus yeomjeoni]|uniref:hypothetical protein n=1 Tax=Halobacillus yeomjeoni TaxID=311194 RepID=UPI001CD52685|nr:hypothetical protein [Halobacillus yeomjeoni]MCA0984640.1 hypothetical protein [Halobacillus yeomjeoni]
MPVQVIELVQAFYVQSLLKSGVDILMVHPSGIVVSVRSLLRVWEGRENSPLSMGDA